MPGPPCTPNPVWPNTEANYLVPDCMEEKVNSGIGLSPTLAKGCPMPMVYMCWSRLWNRHKVRLKSTPEQGPIHLIFSL